jgi:protein-S-isoprenylcysteine O-methyltransferase Ste14
MRKPAAILGTAVFFLLAPAVLGGVIPWWIAGWQVHDAVWAAAPVRWLGMLLLLAGSTALIECFVRFAIEGRGTPAPPLPTETLVVSGFYRHVRNPMYLAVFIIVCGQGLWLGDLGTLIYAGCVWLGFTAFVALYEEPTLRRTYGVQYETYCAQVPRWVPRLTPWKPQSGASSGQQSR